MAQNILAWQDGFVQATGSQWTRVFFIAWWVVGVCVLLNVLVSLILEAFIDAWKKEKDNREFAISARKTRRQESRLNLSASRAGGGFQEEDLDIFQDLGVMQHLPKFLIAIFSSPDPSALSHL